MITIDNELELFSIKGNVVAGKLLLLSILENKHLNHDDIKTKVVDEYGIMKPKHFIFPEVKTKQTKETKWKIEQ